MLAPTFADRTDLFVNLHFCCFCYKSMNLRQNMRMGVQGFREIIKL